MGDTVVDEKMSEARLTDEEKRIIERQLETPEEKIGYFTLFRYATKKEAAIMLVSLVASIAGGACMPLMTVREQYQTWLLLG